MTQYKKYLFEEGPFPKPTFSSSHINLIDFPIEEWSVSEKAYDPLQIKDNERFTNIVFGVDSAEVVNNYLTCSLTSNVGTVKAKMWSKKGINFKEVISSFKDCKVYQFSGTWNEWPKGSGKFSAVIESYVPIVANSEDLLPRITESRIELRNELLFYISTLSENVQTLALDFLKTVWKHFIIRPAAKGHHHYQLGGLLQHTVEVMRIAYHLLIQDRNEQEETFCFVHKLTSRILWTEKQKQRKDELDGFCVWYEKEEHLMKVIDAYLRTKELPGHDVVIFSILSHDIGKLIEYTHFGDSNDKYKLWFPDTSIEVDDTKFGVSMDPVGANIGHITLGTMLVNQFWNSGKYNSIPHTFWLEVMGCILSHHGRLDWQSTKVPSTANEWLVHFCDFIDSKFANEK